MAIKQIHGFATQYMGDGVSTSLTFDVTKLVKQAGVLPATPSAIFNATITWAGVAITGTTLSGSVVTISLDSAPALNAEANVSVNLLF